MADDWGDPQPRVAPAVTGDGKPYTPPASLQVDVPGRGRRQTDTAAGSVEDYIRQGVIERGGDTTAIGKTLHTAKTEGGTAGFLIGDHGSSGGAFQLHLDDPSNPGKGTSMGDEFFRKTGKNPLDPKNHLATIDFVLDHGKAHNWEYSPDIWHGLRTGKERGSDWDAPARIARTDKPGGRFADEGIAFTQERPRTRMFWVDPNEYINDREEQSDKETKPKRRSLRQSLALGADIEVPPEFQGEIKGGKLVLTGGDGAQRARAFAEAGGTLMPVAVTGIPKEGDLPKEYVNLRGETKPLDWTPMPPVSRETPVSSMVTRAQGGLPQTSSIPSTFPFNAPGIEYGNVLPFAVNTQTKEMGFAIPEAIRSPVRSAVEMGERALGYGEAGQDPMRPLSGEQSLNLLGTELGRGMGSFGDRLIPERAAPTQQPVNALAQPSPYPQMTASGPLENLARQEVSQGFGNVAAGTGGSPMQVIGDLAKARAEGQAMVLADFPELQAIAGTTARSTGEAGGRMTQFMKSRKDAALGRLDKILAKYFPTGSVKRTMKELGDERSAQAQPLYTKAYDGGSLAPLESQFQKEWTTAGQVAKNAEQNVKRIEGELNQALARQSQAGNVYATSGANRAVRFAEDKIKEQRQIADQARAAEQASLGRLRQAQQDGTANAPGAVWSPTIQRLLGNRHVQAGIRKGLDLIKNEGDATGAAFRRSEYAIVGTDAAGEPIVGAVPTMRLLAAAKQGLDSLLEQPGMSNDFGRLTAEGRTVLMLKNSLLDELYRLNPDYKVANEFWAGKSESMRAMLNGQHALDKRVRLEDVRDDFSALSEGSKDFYRLGIADEMRNDILNTRIAGDASKSVVNTEATRQKLRAVMGEDAEKFVDAVATERTMFETAGRLTGGAQTAGRMAEDASPTRAVTGALHLGHALAKLSHGHPLGAMGSIARGVRDLRTDTRLSQNPELLNEISKLLTDPDIALQGRQGASMLPQLMEKLPQTQNALQRGAAQARQRATQNALTRWSGQFQNPTAQPPMQMQAPPSFRPPP